MTLPTDVKGAAAGADVMKIDAGQTEILIVGPAVTGYEYWKEKGGPVRQVEVFDEPLPDDAKMREVKDDNGNVIGKEKDKQKFFWAMPVYSFKTKKFEILQAIQKGIREDLLSLQNNPNWGDPTGKYTITIDRSGTGFGTKYKAVGNPSDDAKKAEIARIVGIYAAAPMNVAEDLFGTSEEEVEAVVEAPIEPVEAPTEVATPAA